MPETIPHIRVVLSAPSDDNEERKIALDVIDYFLNRPAFRPGIGVVNGLGG